MSGMGYPMARGGKGQPMPPGMMYSAMPMPPSFPPHVHPHAHAHHHHHHHHASMHRGPMPGQPPMPTPQPLYAHHHHHHHHAHAHQQAHAHAHHHHHHHHAHAHAHAHQQAHAHAHHHHHHHHAHAHAHHQHQHQRNQRPPAQAAQGQPQPVHQHERSALAKVPTKDELNKRYEMIISQPPPPPAYKTKPQPLVLREGRNCTISVRMRLPDGVEIRVPLDLEDQLNDVRAAVEKMTSYMGVELLVYHSDHEVRNLGMTVKDMGIQDGELLEVKLDQARSGWGIAAVPENEPPKTELQNRPGYKEDTEEFKALKPGEIKVMQGYEDKPMSSKGKLLMDIYEEVMSRPPPGTCNDPRAEMPCSFYAAGKACKYGEKCIYSHAGKRGQGGVFFQRPDPRSKVACVFFKANRCLKHQTCPFKHDRGAQQPKRPLTNPDLPGGRY